MTLAEILMLKFPDIDLLFQVNVTDSGSGPHITKWDTKYGPLPTSDLLTQWEKEVQPLYDQVQFIIVNQETITKLQNLDAKTIRALRENDSVRLQQLNDEAAQLRTGLIR